MIHVCRNSGYGSLLMSKEKHTKISYTRQSHESRLKINDPRFRTLSELDDGVYEIEMAKQRINLDLPIQLGFFILQYAKQRMLEFYFDFLDVYIGRDNFVGGQMDTDSFYFGINSNSLEEAILPHMKADYNKSVYQSCHIETFCPDALANFLPRRCCPRHVAFDQKTPGLFKTEFEGDILISLCSKMYASVALGGGNNNNQEDKFKCSSKGLSKMALEKSCKERQCNTVELYRRVLDTARPSGGENMGFRLMGNQVVTYRQRRESIGYFYVKRKVATDGRSTEPLDILLKL